MALLHKQAHIIHKYYGISKASIQFSQKTRTNTSKHMQPIYGMSRPRRQALLKTQEILKYVRGRI